MADTGSHRSRRLRWVVLGVIASVASVVLISAITGVSLSDVVAVGALPFATVSVISLIRLAVQAVRFRVLVLSVSNLRVSFRQSGEVRTASEFAALTTPSLIGGEFVRAAWLSSEGINVGRALWIGYFEAILDVYMGASLSIVAAAYALLKGSALVATAILGVVFPVVAGYSSFFLLPAIGLRRVPLLPFRIAARIVGKERADRALSSTRDLVDSLSSTSREVLKKRMFTLMLKLISLTLLMALLSGFGLWAMFNLTGESADFLSSLLAVHGSFALAALPITPGGVGITEVVVQWYTTTVLGFGSWATVIAWRVASYYVVLSASGVFFIKLLIGLIRAREDRTDQKGESRV